MFCFALLNCNIILQYFNNFKLVYLNIMKKRKVPLPFINQNTLVILASEKCFEMLILILYCMPEFSRKLTFPTCLGFWLFRVSLTNWIVNGMYSFIYINSIVPVCFVFLWVLIFSSAAWKWISVCLFSKGTVKGRADNCLIKIFVRKTCLF